MLLESSRIKAEQLLKQRKEFGRISHAILAETLDRILLAYERGQIDESRLDFALKVWYRKMEEATKRTLDGGGSAS